MAKSVFVPKKNHCFGQLPQPARLEKHCFLTIFNLLARKPPKNIHKNTKPWRVYSQLIKSSISKGKTTKKSIPLKTSPKNFPKNLPKEPPCRPPVPPTPIAWVSALRCALQHGGTQRPKRDRREAKRKQLQLATVDPVRAFAGEFPEFLG